MLILLSQPRDRESHRAVDELCAIEMALGRSAGRRQFVAKYGFGARLDQLSDLLHEHKPSIVHFVGHGDVAGRLSFQDAQRRAAVADPKELADYLGRFKRVRCGYFAACASAKLAREMANYWEAAIGFEGPTHDDDVRIFSGELYSALSAGWSVEAAFQLAARKPAIDGQPKVSKPVRFYRDGVDGDKIYFVGGNGPGEPNAHELVDAPVLDAARAALSLAEQCLADNQQVLRPVTRDASKRYAVSKQIGQLFENQSFLGQFSRLRRYFEGQVLRRRGDLRTIMSDMADALRRMCVLLYAYADAADEYGSEQTSKRFVELVLAGHNKRLTDTQVVKHVRRYLDELRKAVADIGEGVGALEARGG